MFISNISQTQSTRFCFKSNIQKCFPARELILEKLDNNLAKQLGVKVPTTKDEQKSVVSEIYKQLHMIMLSLDKYAPVLRFIKLPTSKEEMAAQLDFLTHRHHLSDCINLMNEKAKLLMNRNLLSALEGNNPNISSELNAKLTPHIPEIKQELSTAGDVNSKLKSLSNRISYAEIEQRESVQYFKDLEKKQAILEDLGLLTDDMADQYWRVLREENINNSNFSAEQLIDIINKRAKIQTSSVSLTSEEKAAKKAQKRAAEAARKAQKEAAAKARKEAAQELEKQKQAEKAAQAKENKANKLLATLTDFIKRNNIGIKDCGDVIVGKKTLEEVAPNESAESLLKIKQAITEYKSSITDELKTKSQAQGIKDLSNANISEIALKAVEAANQKVTAETRLGQNGINTNVTANIKPKNDHVIVSESRILTKKQLLANAKNEFEMYLRQNIDFYRVMNDNVILSELQKTKKSGTQQDVVTISITGVADKVHKAIYDKYALSIDKHKADNDLLKLFTKILNTYRMNAGKIGNMVLEMRNVGAYWRYMERDGIVELKGYKDKIANLEQKLKLNDADKDLIKEYSQIKVRLLNESDYVEALNDVKAKLADDTLTNQPELAEKLVLLKQELEKTVQYNKRYAVLEKMLKFVKGNEKELRELIDTEYKMAENKYIWTQYLENAVEAEKLNRQSAAEQKCTGIYNYITGESASIKNYRALDDIRIKNEGKLPEEIWDRILTYAGEDGSLSNEAWAKILK